MNIAVLIILIIVMLLTTFSILSIVTGLIVSSKFYKEVEEENENK